MSSTIIIHRSSRSAATADIAQSVVDASITYSPLPGTPADQIGAEVIRLTRLLDQMTGCQDGA